MMTLTERVNQTTTLHKSGAFHKLGDTFHNPISRTHCKVLKAETTQPGTLP
jgi:hypothetical protein